jgi:hypothetical protein
MLRLGHQRHHRLIRSAISWSTWASVCRVLSCVGDKDVPAVSIGNFGRATKSPGYTSPISDALCVTPLEWAQYYQGVVAGGVITVVVVVAVPFGVWNRIRFC